MGDVVRRVAPAAARISLAAVLLSALPAASARAQEPRRFASPAVDPEHWAVGAARRLAVLGLLGQDFGWGERTLTRRELGAAFLEAERRADAAASPYAALARAYRTRFAEEFGPTLDALEDGPSGGLRSLAGALRIGWGRRAGELRAGIGYDNATDWTGPAPVAGRSSGVAAVAVGAAAPPHSAFTVEPEYSAAGVTVRGAQLAVALGGVGVWLGRRRIGFGPGRGGGIVLTGATALDGGGFRLLDPVTLPGPLARLGPVRLQAAVSRVRNGERGRAPWFWAARASIAPHHRLRVGVSRAAMFGGAGTASWKLRDLAYMLIGKHAGRRGEFDNQVVAVDLHYLPPVPGLPLLVYVEWGMDDSAGALVDVPGVVAGLEVAALPGLRAVGLRLERTVFAASCCGNTIWYRNWAFRGGWTDGGRPLGHPLGGHGDEWLAELYATARDARIRASAGTFLRDRGIENLFAPDRAGDSAGGWLRVEVRTPAGIELFLSTELERGRRGWRRTTADAGLRWLFR